MIGKGTLFVVAAVALAGMLLSYGINTNVIETEARVAEDEFEILARNAALAGLSQGVQKLADEITTTSGSYTEQQLMGTYESGRYVANIEDAPPSDCSASDPPPKCVRIHSIGTTLTARSDTMDFDVQAYYRIEEAVGSGSEGEIPEPLQEAITSQCDVTLGGSALIRSEGGNANVRTNAGISVNGKANGKNKGVLGRGYMTESPPSRSNDHLYSWFNPTDELGGSSVSQVEPLSDEAFSEVDQIIEEYRSRADYVVYTDPDAAQEHNDEGLSGTAVSGLNDIAELSGDDGANPPSENDPLIIRTVGDLHLNQGALPAYTIFIVDGDLHVNGNATVGGGEDSYEESLVAFYVENDMRINGTAEVWGQFYVGGYGVGNGNFTLNGNLTYLCNTPSSSGSVTSGNFELNYFPANPALTGAQPEWTLERETHSEW